ncbi:unnamed protein product [Urochloa humidicola]
MFLPPYHRKAAPPSTILGHEVRKSEHRRVSRREVAEARVPGPQGGAQGGGPAEQGGEVEGAGEAKQENVLRTSTKLQRVTNPKTIQKITKSKKRKQLKAVPDEFLGGKKSEASRRMQVPGARHHPSSCGRPCREDAVTRPGGEQAAADGGEIPPMRNGSHPPPSPQSSSYNECRLVTTTSEHELHSLMNETTRQCRRRPCEGFFESNRCMSTVIYGPLYVPLNEHKPSAHKTPLLPWPNYEQVDEPFRLRPLGKFARPKRLTQSRIGL